MNTFEEEEAVDLSVVAGELVSLDKEISLTDDNIANFCQQLNISTPF